MSENPSAARPTTVVEVTSEAVLREIVRILQPSSRGGRPVTLETHIAQDLDIDSLKVMDVMMELEEKFNISIPLNLIPQFETVKDIVDTVEKIKRG
jgi:acyl carrier protein